MAPSLIPCPACGCHAKSTEASCPNCGEPLRRGDGSVPRTAAAVLLGLSAAGALAACSSTHLVELYGIAVTTSSTGDTGGSGTGGGDAGGSTNDGGTGG